MTTGKVRKALKVIDDMDMTWQEIEKLIFELQMICDSEAEKEQNDIKNTNF